jgi:predicted membrane-bound spermidine synthase
MSAKRRALEIAFVVTGSSSLALQIAWQRVLAREGQGTTTVVAAFMAGIGLGSVLGGAIADRVSPRLAVRIYALVNFGVGITAAGSVAIFGGGADWLPRFESEVASFAFHFLLLSVPAGLLGFALPLLARGVVKRSKDLPELVGRLYSLNVFGSAVGAGATTWLVLKQLGVQGTTWLCAGLLALAALGVVLVFRKLDHGRIERTKAQHEPHPWRWYVASFLLGLAALGLELVYFRVGAELMRDSPISFGHVLTIFFVLYAGGAAWGSRQAETMRSAVRAFRWAMLGAGAMALLGLAVARQLAGLEKTWVAYGLAPVLMMGGPVFLFGAAFPFVMAAARSGSQSAGGRVGALQGALYAGNVAGALVTGFVLLEKLGVMETAMVFAALAIVTAVGARGGLPLTPTLSPEGEREFDRRQM